jgi:nucleoside phosphorylase
MSEMGKNNLCVVTAVDIEFKTAVRLLIEKSFSERSRMKICRGRFGDRRIAVLQSEMGAAGFAEFLEGHLATNRYDALIVAGLAGGLDPKLRAGDAVVYDLCYDARTDGAEVASIAGDDGLSRFLFEALKASGCSCVRGSGITVSKIITEAEDKLALGARCNAAAVDMETYQVFGVCRRFNLPAAALRVISDRASHDLPDFNRAYEADGRMNLWRTAGVMTARPAAAVRFLLSVRPALRSLGENLKTALGA